MRVTTMETMLVNTAFQIEQGQLQETDPKDGQPVFDNDGPRMLDITFLVLTDQDQYRDLEGRVVRNVYKLPLMQEPRVNLIAALADGLDDEQKQELIRQLTGGVVVAAASDLPRPPG